jgi:hypothetical protein
MSTDVTRAYLEKNHPYPDDIYQPTPSTRLQRKGGAPHGRKTRHDERGNGSAAIQPGLLCCSVYAY